MKQKEVICIGFVPQMQKKKKSPIKNATHHMNRLKNIQVIREAGKEFSKILYQLMIKLLWNQEETRSYPNKEDL